MRYIYFLNPGAIEALASRQIRTPLPASPVAELSSMPGTMSEVQRVCTFLPSPGEVVASSRTNEHASDLVSNQFTPRASFAFETFPVSTSIRTALFVPHEQTDQQPISLFSFLTRAGYELIDCVLLGPDSAGSFFRLRYNSNNSSSLEMSLKAYAVRACVFSTPEQHITG